MDLYNCLYCTCKLTNIIVIKTYFKYVTKSLMTMKNYK